MQNKDVQVKSRKIAYLSGAPRVSTRLEAEESGPRSHVIGIMEAFVNLGWKVSPYIFGDHVPTQWLKTSAQAKLRQSTLTRIGSDLYRVMLNHRNQIAAKKAIGQDFDWVYERLGSFQSLGRAFQKLGIPWILETNAPLFFEAKTDRKSLFFDGLARKIEVKAYRDCDVLVCVSEILQEIIIKESGIDASKIVVLPNAVDTKRFDPQNGYGKRLLTIPSIVFVGKIHTWQGLNELIQALGELKVEGIEIGLVVVGDGPAKTDCEDFVEQYQLQDQVIFMGLVPWDEVPKYIDGCDLGYSGRIAPKYGEIYFSPLKLYEYMAMAKPVIAASQKDAIELLSADHIGYLFDPGSVDSLKNSLRKAFEEQHQWRIMGINAREIVVSEHSWTARVRTFIPLAEKIIEKQYGSAYPHY